MAEEKMRKLTVIISDELHRKARIKSVETGKSMSEVVRQALEKWTTDEKAVDR